MLEAYKNSFSLMLRNKRYLLLWVIAAITFFAAYIALPAYLIPGNSLEFQLSLLSTELESIGLFALFALLAGLLVALEVYAWRHKQFQPKGGFWGGSGSFASVFGAVVKGPLCPSCVAAIAGFFGLGFPAVLFVLDHRNEIALLALALIAFSLHYTTKRLNAKHSCECCK